MFKGGQRVQCVDQAFLLLLPVGFHFFIGRHKAGPCWHVWTCLAALLWCINLFERRRILLPKIDILRRPLPFFDPLQPANFDNKSAKPAYGHTHIHTLGWVLKDTYSCICTDVFQGYTLRLLWFLLWQELKLKRKSLRNCQIRNWFFMARCWSYERFSHGPKNVRVRD